MPKWIRSYDYPWALSRTQYDRWLEFMVDGWGRAVSLDVFAPSKLSDAIFCQWWSKLLRYSASPRSLRAILQTIREIDVRECLPHVQAPINGGWLHQPIDSR